MKRSHVGFCCFAKRSVERTSTQIQQKFQRDFHAWRLLTPYADFVMRRAFVLQLGPDSEPHERFEGWIEEVDTGRELRFRSTEELLAFLTECFERAQKRDDSVDERDS